MCLPEIVDRTPLLRLECESSHYSFTVEWTQLTFLWKIKPNQISVSADGELCVYEDSIVTIGHVDDLDSHSLASKHGWTRVINHSQQTFISTHCHYWSALAQYMLLDTLVREHSYVVEISQYSAPARTNCHAINWFAIFELESPSLAISPLIKRSELNVWTFASACILILKLTVLIIILVWILILLLQLVRQ